MKKPFVFILMITLLGLLSFRSHLNEDQYYDCYSSAINSFKEQQFKLLTTIRSTNLSSDSDHQEIKAQLARTRMKLKEIDFWLRYLEPIVYRKINGPLPVEWETEVFEKWESPYRREGAGLTLAELYLEEAQLDKNELLWLIQASMDIMPTFFADSITPQLKTYDHFFLANRMFLLNLAAIYTTGFECPNTDNVIPEMRHMLTAVRDIYECFNQSFPATPLTKDYLDFYHQTAEFAGKQPSDFEEFDHFTFIKDYVNPLYSMNQEFIQQYSVRSRNFNDFSLNNDCRSIFDKSLARVQNSRGIYSLIEDEKTLNEIKHIGKLLFYDPILSPSYRASRGSAS